MANRKAKVAAIILFLVVFGGAMVAFALTVFHRSQAASPIVPTASTLPTPTYTSLNPPGASSPTVAPTDMPASSPPPVSTPTLATAVNGSFELKVSLQKTVFSVGEPVNVTLSITNISNQTVTVAVDAWLLDYIVSNGTSNTIYQHTDDGALSLVIANMPLPSGKNIMDTYSWLQRYSGPNPGPVVSPGTYYIVGKSSTYGLETNPIQISIVNS